MSTKTTDRNAELVRYYKENKCTLQELGTRYGITKERVRQILVKHRVPFRHPRETKPRKTYTKVCTQCNKEFQSKHSSIKNCSKECTSLVLSNKYSKLSDKDLVDIFNLYYADQITGKEIAKLYNMHYTAIYALLAGRNYTTVLKQLGLYDKYINK